MDSESPPYSGTNQDSRASSMSWGSSSKRTEQVGDSASIASPVGDMSGNPAKVIMPRFPWCSGGAVGLLGCTRTRSPMSKGTLLVRLV
jgi:hypothetical protein